MAWIGARNTHCGWVAAAVCVHRTGSNRLSVTTVPPSSRCRIANSNGPLRCNGEANSSGGRAGGAPRPTAWALRGTLGASPPVSSGRYVPPTTHSTAFHGSHRCALAAARRIIASMRGRGALGSKGNRHAAAQPGRGDLDEEPCAGGRPDRYDASGTGTVFAGQGAGLLPELAEGQCSCGVDDGAALAAQRRVVLQRFADLRVGTWVGGHLLAPYRVAGSSGTGGAVQVCAAACCMLVGEPATAQPFVDRARAAALVVGEGEPAAQQVPGQGRVVGVGVAGPGVQHRVVVDDLQVTGAKLHVHAELVGGVLDEVERGERPAGQRDPGHGAGFPAGCGARSGR